MFRISPVLRVTSQLLRRNRATFCIGVGYLNPAKHITMNHNPHNVYIDAYDIGVYPELVEIMSEPPRTYQPIVVSTILEVINKKYPEAHATEELLYKNAHRNLDDYLSRTSKQKKQHFSELLTDILLLLSQRIIVKESRWTWILEQQRRFEGSVAWYDNSVNELTVKEFLDQYNQVIELLVNYSQFGHSKDIIQTESPLERHFIAESNNHIVGIQDLNEETDENEGIINRWMKKLHS